LREGDAKGAEGAEGAGCGATGRWRGQRRASHENLFVDDHLQGPEVLNAVASSLAAGRLCVCVCGGGGGGGWGGGEIAFAGAVKSL
jgi:hypothetical protein